MTDISEDFDKCIVTYFTHYPSPSHSLTLEAMKVSRMCLFTEGTGLPVYNAWLSYYSPYISLPLDPSDFGLQLDIKFMSIIFDD